jgi:hypothetical protein
MGSRQKNPSPTYPTCLTYPTYLTYLTYLAYPTYLPLSIRKSSSSVTRYFAAFFPLTSSTGISRP